VVPVTDDAISYPTLGQPVGAWLDELGSAAPAPGGGAVAAMSAATAAALVEMVGNLTVGRAAYADHEEQVAAVRDAAHRLRLRALEQADEDATAFRALMAAFRLPRQTSEQQVARRSAVQAATRRAAAVPLEVAATAAEVVTLAAQLPGRSNPNVLSDIGVAAVTAAAAIEAAAVNVDVNLASLSDAGVKASLTADLDRQLAVAEQGRQLAARVREQVAG
jgi:formiminotetrahydrofolate cyclodeaminase